MFQSLNRAYKRSDLDKMLIGIKAHRFQSLNRAYKRSDQTTEVPGDVPRLVSIPQSGLQAFRREPTRRRLRSSSVSIPQSGLQAFRHYATGEGAE